MEVIQPEQTRPVSLPPLGVGLGFARFKSELRNGRRVVLRAKDRRPRHEDVGPGAGGQGDRAAPRRGLWS